MHLKKLKLVGFKSFANPTELIFDEGITAIVGPNGCGKSNISDSIRWVLGEQSAKSLRGAKMEDVIFNGTDTKKQLGMAEVSITFSNSDRVLPIDFDEVTVTRRVFRSGESGYFINKSACRLKDVHELFFDTGIGTSAYSSLEQGKIDLILSSKPEDRKQVFEEAAGITKFKAKKKEALRKLEYTEANLIRLEDIVSEVKKQINSINRQAAKARTYKDSFDELKDLEIKYNYMKYEKLSHEIDAANYNQENSAEKEAVLIEDIKNEEDILKAFREKFHDIDTVLAEVQNKRLELERQISNHENEVQYNNRKLEEITETQNRWESSVEILSAKITEYTNDLKKLEEELKATKAEKEAFNLNLKKQEGKVETINQDLSQKEISLNEKKNIIFNNVGEGSKLKNELTDLKIEEGQLKQLKEKLTTEINQITQTLTTIEKEYLQEETFLKEKESRIIAHNETIEKTRTHLKETKEKVKETETYIADNQRNLSAKNSQKEMLLELKNNYEGFFNGVRALMLKRKEDNFLNDELIGVVADIIDVDQKYELAIEVAASSRVQNIITKTDKVIEYAVDFLKKNKLGRATFLALNMIKAKKISISDDILKQKGVLGHAIDFLKFESKYENILNYVLGNCLIVEDTKTAIEIAKYKNINFNIVTLQGELVNPSGAVTGGSMSQKSGSLLGREGQIKKLEEETTTLAQELITKVDLRNNLLETIENKEKELQEESSKKHNLEIEISAIQNSLKKTTEQIANLTKNQEVRNSEIIDIDKRMQISFSKIAETNKNLNAHETISDDLKNHILSLEIAIKEKENEKETEYNNLMQRKLEVNSIAERETNISLNYTHIKSRLEEQTKLSQDRQLDLESFAKQKSELIAATEHATEKIKKFKEEQEAILNKLKGTTDTKNKISYDLIAKEDALRTKRDELSNLQKALRDLEVKYTEVKLKIENILAKIMDEYSLDLKELQTKEEEIYEKNTDWMEVENRILKLKQQLAQIGPVNLMAIEEQEELNKRYEFLSKQQHDLKTAKDDLMKAITKINATTKDLLQETFYNVRTNFRETFVKLFGGGKADLLLTDEKDILESGIEIIAKPPGKKPQHISLLSGGERSMVAVALLFSIYKVKPSPFCLLDEIDAALDEANINRFATLLKDFTEKSQFLVITHNKKTISAANVLYGITMEDAGISKLISVKFVSSEEENKEKNPNNVLVQA